MRFCKVAILMVSATIIFSGCAGRQHNQSYRSRTYAQPAHQNHSPAQQSPYYHDEYNADPPSESSQPQLLPDGPSQPVPAPPPTEASLKKVQGVSFARSCAPDPTCAIPADVCAEAEGCESRKSCLDSFLSKSKSFCNLSRLYRKPAAPALCAVEAPNSACVREPSCHLPESECCPEPVTEGCAVRRPNLPTFSVSKWFTSCFRKPSLAKCDSCLPLDDGCCAIGDDSRQSQSSRVHGDSFYRRSPLAGPLEDPFTQPAPVNRSQVRPQGSPTAPGTVPEIPQQENTLRPVDPMPSNNGAVGDAVPTQDVPAAPVPNMLNPMPSGSQTYVEPSIWPKLRTPQGRIANVPASQTSWNQNTNSYSPPVWSNTSPWSTSWQIQ